MQRRTVLRGLAALAAGAGAGCTANREVPATAPDPPAGIATPEDDGFGGGSGGDGGSDRETSDGEPTPNRQRFVVPDRSFRADEDGDLLAELTVRNRSGVAHEAVMTVRVEAGSKTFTPSRHVVLQPGASQEFVFRFPVPEDRLSGFSISFDPGPPETPIPEGTVTPYPGDGATATDGAATDGDTDTPTATAVADTQSSTDAAGTASDESE